ncbi:DNA-binding response OmpR family regulator [Halospina denitrificans]|uniref:DNA-binding response OmpR family regulator n=1 Tax=Halospina denitrificans TaxID=332522 RepID=A0A4R7JQQ9_9GAMM|nr:response regulator transcription factor [Halospina denitrificans]TDT40265.1 DNA-binding response OmpR family regulator [Halospina denitrificans]
MRLLLIEDEAALAEQLRKALSDAGFATDVTGDGIEAQYLGEQEAYDVAVLDLGLPGRSGLEVLRNWRKAGNALPVLILTARDAWHEKVDGFKAGADDYLGKPFHTEELIARLNALIHRAGNQPGGALTAGGLTLDEERQEALLPSGAPVELTGTEFRLLRYLMLHPDSLLSKSRLTEHVYEYDQDKDSNVIEVYINRLRRRIGHDAIETRRGQGYVFHPGVFRAQDG